MSEQTDDLCLVRVTREAFQRGNRFFYGVSLATLRRQSSFDALREEVNAVGPEDALADIVGLSAAEPGIYRLYYHVTGYDIESGYADDWELRLAPWPGAPR